jgi:SAM-dependent methyltransferase
MKTPQEIVREGYDRLSSAYRAHFELSHNHLYPGWVEGFLSVLPRGGKVLELGCGDGIPVAASIAPHSPYVGIDISAEQIRLARLQVPEGQFEVADMTDLSFPAHSFGGIIALYSIIHIPLTRQTALIEAMHQWLQPGGYALLTVGGGAWEGTETDWILPGVTMYWHHADTPTYLQWLTTAGFDIVDQQWIPEGKGGHTLLLVRKRKENPFANN